MYRALTFLVIFLSCLSVQGQDTCRSLFSSESNIQFLRSHVLLVRLHTREVSIQSLKDRGMNAQAEKLELEQREENYKLVNAFKTSFDFCPVQFFYSGDSEYILNGEIEKIRFLNDSLRIDESISFPTEGFLLAELTFVQQETSGANAVRSTSKEKDVQETGYVGGAYGGFHALIVKDQCFNQLRKPFPFYSRTWKSLGILDMEDVVKTMNKKLYKRL